MLHYWTTAYRYLRSKKGYTAINMAGLAVGIASSLIIFIVIRYELSYDDFQSKGDRIHRVVTTYVNASTGEVNRTRSSTPVVMAEELRTDIPALSEVAAVWYIGGAQMHIPVPGKDLADEKKMKVSEGLFFTEPSYFKIFDFDWLAGGPAGLTDPNTAVLNETLAKSFFGTWQQAIGHTIQMWSFRVPLKIIGVYKDLPQNTDMEVKMGASYATLRAINGEEFYHTDWSRASWPSQCFVLLPPGTNANTYTQSLTAMANKYLPNDLKAEHIKLRINLQPLSDIHLNEQFSTFRGDALTHKELWSLAIIGIFLLLVACINFVNLATAQSVTRAKEIGVRKVLGSDRKKILTQFLVETTMITVASMLFSILLTELALPMVAGLVNKPLSLNIVRIPSIPVFLVLLAIVIVFVAGFYPGVVLSAFSPIKAIKNKMANARSGAATLRRGLVVFQFVVAQLLIIGTMVVVNQMKFFRSQPLGFDKNAVAFIELPSDSLDRTRYGFLKAEMLKLPVVSAATLCMDAPASFASNDVSFYFDGSTVKKDFPLNLQFADTGYVSTFHMKLVTGRIPYASDTTRELLVNETLVKKLGLSAPDAIIGKILNLDGRGSYPVVGVMHDYTSKSLKEAIAPLAIGSSSGAYNYLSIRLHTDDYKSAVEKIQKTFAGVYPTYIFDLSFLDERIKLFYTAEALASNLFTIAAFLAIFISCLGLYGLVSFMATQKTKEVGIRKVLGASVQSIIYLFSREFTYLIGIAFLVAAPIGYFTMRWWLSGFYYHTSIGWTVFASAIIVSIIIAWITVGYKAVKAAVVNPVTSLRTE